MNISSSSINSGYAQDLKSNFWSGAREYHNIPSYLTRRYDFYSSDSQAAANLHLEAFERKRGKTVVGDAVWPDSDGVENFQSQITGELQNSSGPNILELWHGKSVPGAKTYNYYQAFYPAGYFSTPWGENTTLLKIRGEEISVEIDETPTQVFLYEPASVQTAVLNGGCAKLSVKEYHQQFGILSKTASNFTMTAGASNGYPSDSQRLIHGPAEICPPEITAASYFDEYIVNNTAGSTGAGIGGGFFNDNPVPMSLDLDDYYILSSKEDNKPTTSHTTNKINRTTCPALNIESSVVSSKMQNSLNLIGSYNQIVEGTNDSVNFLGNEPTAYWHFAFQQNAVHMPFSNNFEDNLNPGRQINGTIWSRGLGEGTQVFSPVVSSEDWWWKHRQCPEIPSFLPWTFGATISACPSDYFEVPYYSAIRKFGFYGTRFLNHCHVLDTGENVSLNSTPSSSDYSLLLTSAYNEQRYGSFHAGNQGFFLWINYPLYSGGQYFKDLTNDSQFSGDFVKMFNVFNNVYSGKSGFLELQPQLKSIDDMVVVSRPITGLSGRNVDAISEKDLMTNQVYERFASANSFLSLDSGWQEILDRFGGFVSSGTGQPDEEFYYVLNSGIQQRTLTRYLDNVVHGKPVDLFPLNHITYAFDDPSGYLTGKDWGRRASSIGTSSTLPEIDRRYFEGAYGSRGLNSGVAGILQHLDNLDNFNAGRLENIACGSESPRAAFYPVTSGTIQGNVHGQLQAFSTNGWYALGYNEVGRYDSNFSCFTPIFVQNPTSLSCKVGQRPTFRSYAVDYHTIPEDKISPRWSEIRYWGDRLKLLNVDGYLLPHYKLKYQWFRVHRNVTGALAAGASLTGYTGTYYFEYANPTTSGAWCCQETLDGGSEKNCTVVHPTLNNTSINYYQGTMLTHPSTGSTSFGDDKYVYGCIVSGRYGVRTSELAELNLENFILFDIALKNASAANLGVDLSFVGKYYNPLSKTFSDKTVSPSLVKQDPNTQQFLGIVPDQDAAPEDVIAESQPPPNLAYCNGSKYMARGKIGFRGATATWEPPHLTDSRGLRSLWGHPKALGVLRQFKITLDQEAGNFFYGQNHLPECLSSTEGKISPTIQGIKVNVGADGYTITNWQTEQSAWATDNDKIGIRSKDLTHIGELFPPSFPNAGNNSVNNNTLDSPNYGIGHGQFGNNLGAIKSIDEIYDPESASPIDAGARSRLIKSIIQKTDDTVLFGACGYNQSSLGRHMGYYVEVYERFYILCDTIKKKNVRNISYVSPGMRADNAAIQYFWLGQPNDIYLTRLPMYGPYAYQWKVMRNNRDRMGNGMSQAFYSYSAGSYYDLMYDLPAVYGLYLKERKKTNSPPDQKYSKLKLYRENMFSQFFGTTNYDMAQLRGIYFGPVGGGCHGFGDVRLDCPRFRAEDENPDQTDIPQEMMAACDWLDWALYVGASHSLDKYYCGEGNLRNGNCFDPCLSIRYDQGILPGGKKLDLFAWDNRIRITTNGLDSSSDKTIMNGDVRFRGPQNTPYSQYIKNQRLAIDSKYVHDGSLSPCKGGGSDHCNYITATIELGSTSKIVGATTAYNKLASNIFGGLKNTVDNIANDD